jgi:hypothetical protein
MTNVVNSPSGLWRLSLGRWLVVAALGITAAGLLVSLGVTVSGRPGRAGLAEQKHIFVVAGQISRETYGLYLVDYKNSTICVYQLTPRERKLRLVAARTYAYDVQLDAYNTPEAMSPAEVRRIINKQVRLQSKDARAKPASAMTKPIGS